jgi:uncharacterized damage-inducible protein DinB
MNEIGESFITASRAFFADDYLPKLERCLELLSEEQIWWRANPKSNSIGNLLLHLSGNVRQWIVCGLGGAPDQRERDSEFAQREVISRDELLARLKQTLNEADAALARFEVDKLLAPQTIQGCDVTAMSAIYHVVEHFSMHTGQIIMMSKMFAQVDLGFYDFVDAVPVLKWKRAP